MAFARLACCACVAALALLAGGPAVAQAGTRPHTVKGGVPSEPAPPRGSVVRDLAKAKPKRTVIRELKRLRDSGAITPEDYAARRATYDDAKATAKKLTGRRKLELSAVVRTLDSIAARGKLTPSRLAPLFLTLQRNREWWTQGWLPSSGERVAFDGSQLVWQYYPGQGMQIQWLGTFGKLNALAVSKASKRTDAKVSAFVDEILPLAAERAGGLAWEYEFTFDGGAAPWVSSLAQGTGLQALARSAKRLGRQADIFPVTQRALTIFKRRPPEGVRVPKKKGWAGPHYLQYSFAPRLYILNGFVQSIVGLYDYATISGDPTAQHLYAEGEREAAHEVPQFDTGAWSLYSRGSSQHESNLGYHELLIDFLSSLCDRTRADVFCGTAQRFFDYELQPPALTLAKQRLRGGKGGTLRVRLSKISSLTVRVLRGDRVVLARYLGTVSRGLVRVYWAVPRKAGTYSVQVVARDLNGNAASEDGTVQVLKPRKKHKHKSH
jgi:hypothetical protein